MERTDTVIIGAGPIGLELAASLKRSGADYLHFDRHQIGQMVFWFSPETRFFSSNDRIAIAGIPIQTRDQSKATREEYLAYLRTVALALDLKVRTYEQVLAIDRIPGGGFRVTTRRSEGERNYTARRVVLATGGTARPHLLGIPGEDGPQVSHHLHDPHQYFREHVLVVGGKNSAVEAALRCFHVGAKVSLSYRRGQFDPAHVKYWLLPELEGRIKRGEIACHYGTQPTSIAPGQVTLAGTGAGALAKGATQEIKADFVLLMVGYEADMSLFRAAGVELCGPDQTPMYDPQTMETNVPGLYVAGTAAGGTQQTYRLFIENCHVHVDRIHAAITGALPPGTRVEQWMPES